MQNKQNTQSIQNSEKRCYIFPHFMLSNIAKGIQSSHAIVNMFNKYVPHRGNNYKVSSKDDIEKDPFEMLFDWSFNYKTEIMLNPGVSGDLEELLFLLQDEENFYPWAEFYEDEYSLKGIMTAISIVIPEKIYNTASYIRTKNFVFDIDNFGLVKCLDTSKTDIETLQLIESYGRFNNFEMELVKRLSYYRLAQ